MLFIVAPVFMAMRDAQNEHDFIAYFVQNHVRFVSTHPDASVQISARRARERKLLDQTKLISKSIGVGLRLSLAERADALAVNLSQVALGGPRKVNLHVSPLSMRLP